MLRDVHEPVTAALLAASNGFAGFVFPLVLVVACGLGGFWLWSLVDALSWPGSTWDSAGLSRPRWLMRIALLGIVGTALYLREPRRELRAAYVLTRWGG